jgi:hypothetical protein
MALQIRVKPKIQGAQDHERHHLGKKLGKKKKEKIRG